MSDLFDNIPNGIMPLSTTASPNTPVEIYTGPIEMCYDSEKELREAKVTLNWFPHAALVATVELQPHDLKRACEDTDLVVNMPMHGISFKGFVLNATTGDEAMMTIVLRPCKSLAQNYCSHMLFQLVNFTEFNGTPISFTDTFITRGRMDIDTGEWHITIDETPNCKDLMKSLKKQGGFAITHTVKLERTDRTDFLSDVGINVIDALCWYLSFCRGKFVGIPFIRGMGSQGERVFEDWPASIVESWRGVRSWFPNQNVHNTTLIFGKFLELYNDDDWHDTLILSIHWYVTANENFAAIEGSITMAQIAMERLAWTVLVSDRNAVSQNGFDRLCAADKFSLLFNELSIPNNVPSALSNLNSFCMNKQIASIAACITHIRNSIVHPPKKSKDTPTSAVLREAWDTTLWSLEMCILALLDYSGIYVSRINPQITWVGQTELVPWV